MLVDGRASLLLSLLSPLSPSLALLLPQVGLTKKTPRAILRGRIALGGMLTDSLGFWPGVTFRLDCRVGNRVCMGLVV